MELSAAAHHVEEMRTQLRMLEESMGLRIEQVPAQGLLRFTFIFVDPRDPLRRFTFLLQLVGDATYVVHECTPEVPQLPELLDGLNRNPTMFYSFVRGMRRAFKATLQA